MLQTFSFLEEGFIIVVTLERVVRHLVEADNGLVGILDQEILAVLLLHAQVDDAAEDAPCIVHVQVDLRGKVRRPELLSAQDDVARRISNLHTRNVAELEPIRVGQNGLNRPFGQLAGVVLEFVGKHGTSLGIQFLTPIHATRKLEKRKFVKGDATKTFQAMHKNYPGIPFVQGFDVDELRVAGGTGGDGVQLASGNENDASVKIPFAIAIGNRCHLPRFLVRYKRIGFLHLVLVFALNEQSRIKHIAKKEMNKKSCTIFRTC